MYIIKKIPTKIKYIFYIFPFLNFFSFDARVNYFQHRIGIYSISMAFDNSIRLNRYSTMRYITLTPRVRFCPDLTAAFSRRFIYLICKPLLFSLRERFAVNGARRFPLAAMILNALVRVWLTSTSRVWIQPLENVLLKDTENGISTRARLHSFLFTYSESGIGVYFVIKIEQVV